MSENTGKPNLGMEIIKALGLPPRTTRLELIFEGSNPPIVRCQSLVIGRELDEIGVRFAEYELHVKSSLPAA